MLLALFAATIGAAVIAEKKREAEYGYGESTLGRIPSNLWNSGGFGMRGQTTNWRDSNPRYGTSAYEPAGGLLGMRGPTASFRYPMPRPWERPQVGWRTAIPAQTARYGIYTKLNPASLQQHHQRAAAEFANWMADRGRIILAGHEGPLQWAGEGRVLVEMSGSPLSEVEARYLTHLKSRHGLSSVMHRSREMPLEHATGEREAGYRLQAVFDL